MSSKIQVNDLIKDLDGNIYFITEIPNDTPFNEVYCIELKSKRFNSFLFSELDEKVNGVPRFSKIDINASQFVIK